MKYKKMMWLFSSFSWCSSSEELGNRNLKILKFPTDDLKKKNKSELFPVVCSAQLFSGLWFGSAWLCTRGCSDCVSAWQVPYHEIHSVGVCVLQDVLSSRVLCAWDGREEKGCSKRGSTSRNLTFFELHQPFCWCSPVLMEEGGQTQQLQWGEPGQGVRLLCPVPVTHSSCDPNSSSSPATAWHFKQFKHFKVLQGAGLCCLLCVPSLVSWEIFVHQEWTRPEEWLVWKHKFCPVVPWTELPSAPLKQNPDLGWRPVFMFPSVWAVLKQEILSYPSEISCRL